MAWPRGLWLRKEAEPRGGDGGSDSALPVGVEGRRERARGPRRHEQVKHGGRREEGRRECEIPGGGREEREKSQPTTGRGESIHGDFNDRYCEEKRTVYCLITRRVFFVWCPKFSFIFGALFQTRFFLHL